jgi:predicted DNA-binding protein
MRKVSKREEQPVPVKVSLTVALLDRLDCLAGSTGKSRSALVRQAVERLLEDAEDIAVSEARLQDADDELIPWKQVKAEGRL